jgi:hypothetical protein
MKINVELRDRARSWRLKEAIVAGFRESTSMGAALLEGSAQKDWQEILYWLDISGMALYVLDEMRTLGMDKMLPVAILTRLETNLRDNKERTRALLRESARVVDALRLAGVSFVFLKGVTLMPHCVRDSWLRMQVDLDVMVAEEDGATALTILAKLGYMEYAVSGMTFECVAGPSSSLSLADLYRAHPQRALDLHLLRRSGRADRMTRATSRSFYGVTLPSLSAPDILVRQALHLLQHLTSEHTRLSWVLEFWRHVRSRHDDDAFWGEVKSIAAEEPQGGIALGISLLLSSDLFGDAAPLVVQRWALDQVPPGARQWVELYGRKILLKDSVGSKLYLILRQQLLPEESYRAQMWKLLIPMHSPWRIAQPVPNESFAARRTRYCTELGYACVRLRFHVVEGLRFAVESFRWQRRIARNEL